MTTHYRKMLPESYDAFVAAALSTSLTPQSLYAWLEDASPAQIVEAARLRRRLVGDTAPFRYAKNEYLSSCVRLKDVSSLEFFRGIDADQEVDRKNLVQLTQLFKHLPFETMCLRIREAVDNGAYTKNLRAQVKELEISCMGEDANLAIAVNPFPNCDALYYDHDTASGASGSFRDMHNGVRDLRHLTASGTITPLVRDLKSSPYESVCRNVLSLELRDLSAAFMVEAEYFRRFKRLHSLTLRNVPITPQLATAIANTPLSTLNVYGCDHCYLVVEALAGREDLLNLRHLTLAESEASLEDILRLLRTINAPNLRTVYVDRLGEGQTLPEPAFAEIEEAFLRGTYGKHLSQLTYMRINTRGVLRLKRSAYPVAQRARKIR